MNASRRTFQLFCLLILTLSGALHAAELDDLVTMVTRRPAAEPKGVAAWGAGVLVHQEGERAIVITAYHNVASESERHERVYVELHGAPGKDFPARIMAEDANLDLAVLEVDRISVSAQVFDAARHVLVPRGAEIVFEHGGFTIGNPRGDHWAKSDTPYPVREEAAEGGTVELRFPSSVVDAGISGGGLFSIHGALLGMVKRIDERGEGGAIPITTIAGKLKEWKIPFSLDDNPQVIRSASRRVLADLGLATDGGVRNALNEGTPDFGLLHLFWLASFKEEVETAFEGLVEGSQTAFMSFVFDRLGKTEDCRLPGGDVPPHPAGIRPSGRRPLSRAESALVLAGLEQFGDADDRTCAAQMRLWIGGLVQSGLDPDLIVANGYYQREALLAVAMRSKNLPAIAALLRNGASPHPFQDLSGTEFTETKLLAPLHFVLRDFVGAEQDELRMELLSGGMVVSESIRNRALSGLQVAPRLSETTTDPICARAGKRYGFDWCGYLRSVGSTIRFYMGTQDCDSSGYCPAVLTHTLFVEKDRALLLAQRTSYNRILPVVVEVTRESGQWYAWEHGHYYDCIRRADGFEPSYCWRRFKAFPASYSATDKKTDEKRAVAQPSADTKRHLLEHLEVDGISLSTPLSKALTILEAAGYTTKTVAGAGSYRDVLTTRDYTRGRGDNVRTFKVIAMNDGIRALSFRVYGEGASDFKPPASRDARFLFYETNTWKDNNALGRGVVANGNEIVAAAESSIGKSFLHYVNWPTNYVRIEIDLWRRADDETAPEQAFYARWLNEWLGKIKVPGSSEEPCVDRYAPLRGPKGNGCQTPKERAASYLAKVRTGANVRQLKSGLSYEVLVEGQGRKPTANDSIVLYIVFKYLDGARADYPINHWEKVVSEIEWPDIKEAVLSMKEGDTWRLYVPPGVGSNDSSYLQWAEIVLTRVATPR